MGLDNSRLFLVQDFILCYYMPCVPTRSPVCPPVPLRGAVLALLPIRYICTPIIELNTFSINNDHSYQLDDFDNDYQLIIVFQRCFKQAFLMICFYKAVGSILRGSIC